MKNPFSPIHCGSIRTCLAFLFAVTQALLTCLSQPADWIFLNGSIVTMDRQHTIAEAVAVRGDQILAVGSKDEILRHRYRATQVIDLKGCSLIPGLIDSHTHPLGASLIEWDHPIPEMRTIPDVLAYIEARSRLVPPGDWIVLQQVFITRLQERRYPTRAELDTAAPNHPVIFRTGPDASLNSTAMHQLNLSANTEVPEGSKVERIPGSQEPSGIVRNWSRLFSIPSSGSDPTDRDKQDRLADLFRDYNSVGLTTIADRNASQSAMRHYQSLRDENKLTVRIAASRAVSNAGSESQMVKQIALIAEEPTTHSADPMLRTIGIKMFLDGGMLTGSAYMTEPWGLSSIYNIDDPNYRGLRFIPQDKLIRAIEACTEYGLQFTAHSVGDGAVQALVNAYEAIGSKNDRIWATRPNITHCNFLTDESITKMSKLGISADIQPAWLYKDAKTLTEQFGNQRMKRFQPLRPLFDAGVRVGGGSDHMQKIGSLRSVNPYNPFLGMWIAMTRKPEGQTAPTHPEHALTRLEALQCYTSNNAHMLFLENHCGSLEPGKLADLVVLDRDFLQWPSEAIRQLTVKQVFLSGKRIYASEK